MKKPSQNRAIRALVACIASIFAVARPLPLSAQPVGTQEHLVQAPSLESPKRGSLAGAFGSRSFGPEDLSGGVLRLSLPLAFPQERGAPGIDLQPKYSVQNGLSEWGRGWRLDLAIRRRAIRGEINFAGTVFSSPWGDLERGTDGHYYVQGLQARVRLTKGPTSWTAVGPEGTTYTFREVDRTTAGDYAWHLTEVHSLTGHRTTISWFRNSTQRLFVEEVLYGSPVDPTANRIRFAYQSTVEPFIDYRNGERRSLDRYIHRLEVDTKHATTGAYQPRWTYEVRHTTGVGIARYLGSVQRQFAAGDLEPEVRFTYEVGSQLASRTFEHDTKVSALLQTYGPGILGRDESSLIDDNEDGRLDLEVASDFRLLRQTANGWTSETLAPNPAAYPACRPQPSTSNTPRALVRLRGDGEALSVVTTVSFGPSQTYLVVCNRSGSLVATHALVGNWMLGPNTRMVDINRDRRPDLVQVRQHSSVYTTLSVLRNDNGAAFVGLPPQYLTPGVSPTSSWVRDLNGDSVPDLVARANGALYIWLGKTNGRFETNAQAPLLLTSFGGILSGLSQYGVNFVDANGDGLDDLLLTTASSATLMVNRGAYFQEIVVPAFAQLSGSRLNPVVASLSEGDTQIVYVQGLQALTLKLPDTGLMVAAEDGKGGKLAFSYDWSPAVPGVRTRVRVVSSIETSVAWADGKKEHFSYSDPVIHSDGAYLLGFGEVRREQVGQETSKATFYHDDDVRSVPLTASIDETAAASPVSQLREISYSDEVYHGLPFKRAIRQVIGWVNSATGHREVATTDFKTYDRSFCPTLTETSGRHGLLTTSMTLSSPTALATAMHCLPSRQVVSGQHSDAALDFREVFRIERNGLGQPQKIAVEGPHGDQVLQEITYDTLHRVQDILVPGQGRTRAIYDPATGVLSSVTPPHGATKSVTLWDPVTSQPLEMETDRGAGVKYRQHFAYDGFERLGSEWDNTTGSSATSPLRTYSYDFADSSGKGRATRIRTRTLFDAGSHRALEIDDLFFGDNQIAASLLKVAGGWDIQTLRSRDLQKRLAKEWVTDRLPSSADPRSYQDVFAAATGVRSENHLNAFGDVSQQVDAFSAGVTGVTTTEVALLPSGRRQTRTINNAYRAYFEHDEEGRLVRYEDEDGHQRDYVYDAAGRLVRVTLPSGTTQTASYDAYGRVDSVDRSNVGSVQYTYDSFGRIQQVDVSSSSGPERTTEIRYDSIGRPTTRIHRLANGAQRTLTFAYDGAGVAATGQLGFLTSQSGPDFTKRTVYRADGAAVTNETEIAGVWKLVEDYTYWADEAKRGTTRRLYNLSTGSLVETLSSSRERDAYGRDEAINVNGQRLCDLVFDQLDLLSGAIFTNGTELIFDNDAVADRALAQWRYENGVQTFGSQQALNARGLVDSEETLVNATQWIQSAYEHDARGFLSRKKSNGRLSEWQYDADGRLQVIDDLLGHRSSAWTGHTRQIGGRTYQYDDLGRVAERDGTVLTYGPDGYVSRVATPSGDTIEFGYDAEGNRLYKRRNGVLQAGYVGDLYLDASGLILKVEVGSVVAGLVDHGFFDFVDADLRGTVVAENGTPIDHSPYGARVGRGSTAAVLDYVYRGYDADLGTIRMGVRDYDPFLGEFTTPDPMFLEQIELCTERPLECNLYSYAANSPLTHFDLTGTIVGELIDRKGIQAASEGRYLAAFGWAFTKATWDVFGAENISELEWARGNGTLEDVSGWTYAGATLEAAPVLTAVRSTKVLKAAGNFDFAPKWLTACNTCRNLCFVEGTPVATADGKRPIEDIRVGDRVTTLSGASTRGYEGSAWVVSMTMPNPLAPDEDTIHIEQLWRFDEIRMRGAIVPGASVPMDLDELGLKGMATVRSIRKIDVASGQGRLVLLTVRHLNSDVYELRFDGVPQPLRGTGAHRVFSLDRDAWVRIQDLAVGERLQTATGAATLRKLTALMGVFDVYNFEVEGEHEYLVGAASIRAHNTCEIALGLGDRIHNFARGLGRHIEIFPFPSLTLASDGMYQGIMRAMKDSKIIHFNLDGVTKAHFQSWLKAGGNHGVPSPGSSGWTNRELYEILTDPELLAKTVWHNGAEPLDWLD